MKRVYLTIDDAPSQDFQDKLAFLDERDITAIWFCRGDMLEERMDAVVEAVENGNVIGNHSYSHPHFSNITISRARAEVRRTDALIEEVYDRAGVERSMKLFRFPYGDKGDGNRDALQRFLREEGFEHPRFDGITYDWWRKHREDVDLFWTFDCEEWRLKGEYEGRFTSKQDVMQKLRSKNNERGGSLVSGDSDEIVLAHDHEETTAVFKQIIDTICSIVIVDSIQ